MATDTEIQAAMRIGEKNRVTIELIRNWCRHADVVATGGVGMVEELTGLPIGMRTIRCPHAQTSGISAMDLERVALDFHDRNCHGCTHREPVRMPNIASLVGARDAKREADAASARQSRERADAELNRRARRRAAVDVLENHAKKSLIRLIGEFDADPSSDNAQLLLEGARALASGFDSDIEEALFELAAVGPSHASPALTLLDIHTNNRQRLAALALNTAGILEIADKILEADLDSTHATFVDPIVPRLIHRAAPSRLFGFSRQEGRIGPLLSVFKINPSAVEVALRRLLRHDDKNERRAAAEALDLLLHTGGRTLGLKLVDDLLASFARPDDHYDDGPASSMASRTLGQIYKLAPVETESRIDRVLQQPDAQTWLGVVDAYIEVCDLERPADPDVRHRALSWLARALAQLPQNQQVIDRLSDFWTRDVPRDWSTLAAIFDPMLGTVALVQQQIETPVASQVLDLSPPMLKGMQESLRKQVLQRAADAALEVVRLVVVEHPDAAMRARTFEEIERAFRTADVRQARWRGKLIEFLGALVDEPRRAAAVLPLVYQSMTDDSVLVRVGAIHAYQSMVTALGSDSVPLLLHELLVATLRDRYLMVHQAALDAINEVGLPTILVGEAVWLAMAWFQTHSGKHSSLAALALGVVLKLQTHRGRKWKASFAEVALSSVFELDSYDRDRLLWSWSSRLKDEAGFPDAVLRLVRERKDRTPSASELLHLLKLLPKHSLSRIAQNLADAIAARIDDFEDMLRDLHWLFMDELLFRHAVTLCDAQLTRIPDTTENRGWRLHFLVLRSIAAIEAAAQSGDADTVKETVVEFRRLEKAIDEYEKKNERSRSALPLR